MPSNSTQRRSGSGKRPQRGNSGKSPAPKTEPTATAADDDAIDEVAAESSTDETSASTPAKATPAKASASSAGASKATGAARTAKAGTKAGAKAGSKAAPGRGGSGGGKGPGGKGPGKGPAGKGGGRGRQPVKVKSTGLPWGNIVLGGIVGIVALSIIGYGVWYSWDASKPFGERRSQQIEGVENYRAKDVKWLTQNHVTGKVKYQTSPPVGGNHNGSWENCQGDVYAKQIPSEHAVHSLEHGAVWVTYNPDLPQAQIDELAKKVKGKDYMLMSPYPGLDKPISLQAWGFQLKVDNASDKRIDEFITQYRLNASVESGAVCSNGVTVTGDTPQENGDADMNQNTGS
ncbi:DUF3105 domain-containing protein [Cryptosporangium japonicum]|uniref:DUF3105 domain-containing protein n=1 Tax=Cryptosporangium japonicum TaxID=80872 RepID=A0ABN0V9S7_9ACTN